eukprot:gene21840-26435_t
MGGPGDHHVVYVGDVVGEMKEEEAYDQCGVREDQFPKRLLATSHTNYFGAQQGLPPENMLSPLQSVPNMTNMSPWPQNVVWNTPHPAYPHTQYPAPNLAHSPHGA